MLTLPAIPHDSRKFPDPPNLHIGFVEMTKRVQMTGFLHHLHIMPTQSYIIVTVESWSPVLIVGLWSSRFSFVRTDMHRQLPKYILYACWKIASFDDEQLVHYLNGKYRCDMRRKLEDWDHWGVNFVFWIPRNTCRIKCGSDLLRMVCIDHELKN